MTTFPGSPRLLKGALVSMADTGPPNLVVFQYNPSEITRSLEPQYDQEGSARPGAQRFAGPPMETISLEVEINAADMMERGLDAGMGVHPQLAALEVMMSPGSALVIANIAQAALGVLELVPPVAPLTLFVWGPRRVQPVRLSSYSATETYHDPLLTPIAARVSLSLQSLSYRDFPLGARGQGLAIASQVMRETLAALAPAADIAAVSAGAKLF